VRRSPAGAQNGPAHGSSGAKATGRLVCPLLPSGHSSASAWRRQGGRRSPFTESDRPLYRCHARRESAAGLADDGPTGPNGQGGLTHGPERAGRGFPDARTRLGWKAGSWGRTPPSGDRALDRGRLRTVWPHSGVGRERVGMTASTVPMAGHANPCVAGSTLIVWRLLEDERGTGRRSITRHSSGWRRSRRALGRARSTCWTYSRRLCIRTSVRFRDELRRATSHRLAVSLGG
jgi:hypothetical protein